MQQHIKPLKSQKFCDLNTCWVGFNLIPAKKALYEQIHRVVTFTVKKILARYIRCLRTNIHTSFCQYGIMPRKLATFHFFCQLMVMGARLDVHKYKLAHFIHHVPVFLHRGSIHHSCLSWGFFTEIFPAGAVLKNIVTKGTDEKIYYYDINRFLWTFSRGYFTGRYKVAVLKFIFIFLFDKWRCYVLVVLINIGTAQSLQSDSTTVLHSQP